MPAPEMVLVLQLCEYVELLLTLCLDKKRTKAGRLRAKMGPLMKSRAELLTTRTKLSNDVGELDRSLASRESRRKYRCIGIRNQYIKNRIQQDFSRRQRKLARLTEHDKEKYDGSVEVFPVSGAAIRYLLKDKKPILGFPSKPYTGIPALREWLGKAAFVYREEHLDSVLHGLSRLHDGIRSWSDDTSQGKVSFSRQDLEALLKLIHDNYRSVSVLRIGIAGTC